ncbi:hypothetical protein ACFL6M_07460 [Candidatus Eisenbacteria bacterium]|uniref:TIR domain-containing protein n=1 Tax=Eiseniibacteriota bacterium TaxID=2212470 RepID=A0ABV6YM65_UNCEI
MAKTKLTTAKGRRSLEGKWTFTSRSMTYRGPDDGSKHPLGLAVSDQRIQKGVIQVTVELPPTTESAGKVLLGYRTLTDPYFSVGLGGHKAAYVVSEWVPDSGWHARRRVGQRSSLVPGRRYELRVTVKEDRIGLAVDSVPVLNYDLQKPVPTGRIGAFAWGHKPVRFGILHYARDPVEAFVVMQFSPRYERAYRELIQVAASRAGIIAKNVGEEFGPGNILDDIAKGIQKSAVVIAEVTPANRNVFYEVGYAHAIGKPTILVAQKGTKLPFDLTVHKCLFYQNNNVGRQNACARLKKHIDVVLRNQGIV